MSAQPGMIATSVIKSSTSSTTSSSHNRVSYNTSKMQDTVRHTLTDDGAGSFGPDGTINYAGKTLNVRFVDKSSTTEGYTSDFEDAKAFETTSMSGGGGDPSNTTDSKKGGDYRNAAVGEQVLAASTVTVTYAESFAAAQAHSMSWTPPPVTIDLCPYTADYIVPNSVRFTWMGHVYEDFDGVLVRDYTSAAPGIIAGQVDYSTGVARVFDYVVGEGTTATDFALQSLWTVRQNWTTASIFMRTQAAPLKPSGVVLNLADAQGNAITAIGDINGTITGTHLRGKIDYQYGLLELQFGDFVEDIALTPEQKAEWWYSADDVGAVQAGKIWRPWPVDPTTLRYNSVSYFYLPIDAEILGLDPVRLPQDGRVPIFLVGSYVVIGHTATTPPATVSNGQAINCARTRLSRVRMVGADGKTIRTGYTVDLDAGIVTPVDVSGWLQPVHVEHRIEQLERLRDVQINGDIATVGQLAHDFPAGSTVSSAITSVTMRARVSQFWDQQTWDGITWVDNIIGNPAAATYNDTLAPVELTNAGALTERFALRFTSSTSFECIGEHVGFIGTGSINTDFAPVNSVGNAPYFTIRALGWGGGWAAGNVQFVHIVGAITPFACIRTVQMGPPAGIDYSFELLGRGDVDRPPSAP